LGFSRIIRVSGGKIKINFELFPISGFGQAEMVDLPGSIGSWQGFGDLEKIGLSRGFAAEAKGGMRQANRRGHESMRNCCYHIYADGKEILIWLFAPRTQTALSTFLQYAKVLGVIRRFSHAGVWIC